MNKVKVGVIGIGNMGSGHVRMMTNGDCPEFELVAICDLIPERMENALKEIEKRSSEAGEAMPEIACFTDAIQMLDSGLLDAVTVAVPHYDHPKYVIAALERGIHVLCEKPAGVYTRQVREMNRVAAEHPDTTFAMMFNQRTDHVYRKMKEIIDSGELGQIKRVNWIITNWYRPQKYYDSGAWRATWSGEGGGVLLNQCPHQLDLWQWICGMPVKVDAHLHYGKWHDIEVEDDVTAYVEYANGATGVFITSTGDAPGTNRFEILCDGGKLVCEEGRLTLDKNEIFESEFRVHAPRPFSEPAHHKSVVETDGQSPQHKGVLNAFAAHILRGEPLIADGSEGINGLTISNAMHLSSWLNRPVDLPFDEDLFYDELMKRVRTSRRKEGVTGEVADTEGSYNTK
ncbi:MAG: Gfo/Idh/MocA family protein [Eubacteriales bacterium]